MGKRKFFVNVSTTMSTDVVIAAESEEEAVKIARDMAFDDYDFAQRVIDSWSGDSDTYRAKYWEFDGCGEANDMYEADNEE